LALFVDADSLRRTKSGAVVGTIYFRANAFEFPDGQWTDFPVVVLAWWLGALRRFRAGAAKESFEFMDGPHSVELGRSDDNVVLTFLSTSVAPARLKTVAAKPIEVVRALTDAARLVIAVCDEKAWPSEDLEELRVRYSECASDYEKW
jgi:hypothetical protein